jgi:hypothetical protein
MSGSQQQDTCYDHMAFLDITMEKLNVLSRVIHSTTSKGKVIILPKIKPTI